MTTRGSPTLHGTALWLALLAATAVGACVAEIAVGAASNATDGVRPAGVVNGTVTIVNAEGTSLCLDPDRAGGQLCTDFVAPRGVAGPSQGGHVTGTLLWVPRGGGAIQMLVVTQSIARP